MRMPIRAAVVGASGALALTAFVTPAAHAATGSAVISKVVINGGKPVVMGTTNVVKVTATITASDKSRISKVGIALWHGPSSSDMDGLIQAPSGQTASCTVSGTSETCTLTLEADPRSSVASTDVAGSWHVYASVKAANGDSLTDYTFGSASVLRYDRLTTNATPEPIKKGKTLTIKGSLTRANWDTFTYKAYTGRSVKLEFKKKGSTTWSTVKSVTSSSTGSLSTTVKAASDGYWRYVYGGSSTSPAVTSTSDYVDVQ
jgi:hypothetical protein